MLELAAASGTLVGETEVCSGGDKMLLRFFDVLVGDTAAQPASDELLAFGAHYADFKLLLWIYFLARRFLFADAGVELPAPVEPSDFFIVEPANLRDVPHDQRLAWFRQVASLVVPFAPRGAALPLRDAAFQMAAAMGMAVPPALAPRALEQVFGRVVEGVVCGFGGDGVPPLDRIVPRRHADLANSPNAPAG